MLIVLLKASARNACRFRGQLLRENESFVLYLGSNTLEFAVQASLTFQLEEKQCRSWNPSVLVAMHFVLCVSGRQ